nr:MAG TPA: hypothetical protein [Caudoviricetes sp.]
MGCDIHLRVEARPKINPYSNQPHYWSCAGFFGEFSSRAYGMFARMAAVRSYNDSYKVQFKPRGLPKDIVSYSILRSFYLSVTDDKDLAEYNPEYCHRTNAEEWVKVGISKWVGDKKFIITNPDYHSASWLTTQELRQCFDDCFKEKDGTYRPNSDYIDWLGLISLCEGIESDGIYECRVVFAFDN